jgi:hypothetical protein
MSRPRLVLPLLVALVLGAGAARAAGAPVPIGTGADLAAWKAIPADGVSLGLSDDAGALRMDVDFHGGGGYAVAHRAVSLDLPPNWRFSFRVRGDVPPNNLEFKLLDASGDNVWWLNQRDVEFTPEGRRMTIKKRQVSFAWGPLGGGEIPHVAALEFAVTAGHGGRGSVWIDDLRLEPMPVPDTTAHAILLAASSTGPMPGEPGESGSLAPVRGWSAGPWASAAGDAAPALTLDLGASREYGGLEIDWAAGFGARDYDVETSADGATWAEGRSVRGGNGGRDHVWMPESESRWVRLTVRRAESGDGRVGLRRIEVKPLAWSATLESFFGAIAKESPRGDYPRGMLGENIFWTVVGQDFDDADGLVDEVGRLETGKGAFSVEPFLRDGGRLFTWNDVVATPRLDQGDLPIPEVRWDAGDVSLQVIVFPRGAPGASELVALYHVTNHSRRARRDTLYLALRPFQVNPPTQFLNVVGGTAPIRQLARDGRVIRANGDRGVVSLTEPAGFGAATFDQGDIIEYLRAGRLPGAAPPVDPFAHASGALAYVLDLPAGGSRDVVLLVPLHARPADADSLPRGEAVAARACAWLAQAEAQWRERLDRVTIALPDTEVARAVKAQLAWVLVNRAGPAIQPGTRSYARSWIRDGCLTSSALLRLGETEAVRQFIEWFAPFQFANGKAPCCVDARGADPVPEHDSSGELIYLVAEYVRFTGDRAFAERMWPHVLAAAGYLDTLRAQRLGPEWSTPETAPFHGLLPPSISHEGYSAKPMHSYWDDFFALRGFKDAAWLATWLGRPEAASLARDRDAFAADFAAAIRATQAAKHIDYVPGCSDLGDFDPTSTSIALNPVNAGEDVVSRAALERTFERYWEFFTKRRDGREPWDAFTPYEWRSVGAMARLGWRDRADSALAWFMGFRRPPGFEHWAEVVWHDERAPHFIGDMPHTWVGTDFVRSVLDMIAYEDESDSSLVIGAGVPSAWLAGDGTRVSGLRTRWGAIDVTLRRRGSGGEAVLRGRAFRMPPGGISLRPPGGPAAGLPVRRLTAGRAVTIRWR